MGVYRGVRRGLSVALLCIAMFACTKTVYVPIERKVTVTVKETDTLVMTKIEKETVHVETPDTCAHAETKYAEADACVSKGRLNLNICNKDAPVETKTKVITKTIYDSIPYPVEVPVIKKVRYVAWYDKVSRWISGIVVGVLLLVLVSKIIKWKRGFLL